MNAHVSVPEKAPDVAAHDRGLASAGAGLVFVAVMAGLVVALRRLRARAELDAADRVLRGELDALAPRGGVGPGEES